MGVRLPAVACITNRLVMSAMPAVLAMYDRVPAPMSDQPKVYREGHHESNGQRDGQAAPEKQTGNPRIHSAGNQQDDGVVHDFHHGD